MGYVDEWTQIFTDIKMFGLAVYLKIKQHKIFIAELCRGSSDSKITIYAYVKQVLLGTPADLRKIQSRLDFWTCWRKTREKNKTRANQQITCLHDNRLILIFQMDYLDIFGYTFASVL